MCCPLYTLFAQRAGGWRCQTNGSHCRFLWHGAGSRDHWVWIIVGTDCGKFAGKCEVVWISRFKRHQSETGAISLLGLRSVLFTFGKKIGEIE